MVYVSAKLGDNIFKKRNLKYFSPLKMMSVQTLQGWG